MKRTIINLGFALGFMLGLSADGFAQMSDYDLLSDLPEGWEKVWIERKLGVAKPTKYEVKVENDTNQVLKATSIESASALWRMLDIRPGSVGKISWRWRVERTLSDKTKEKTKEGEDYAARVIVVFEPHLVSWKTRAICYVWAAKQPVGSIYRSPYASSVGVIVLQSGKDKRGEWIAEERNFVADYHKVFGRQPELVTAVALMVDTDNTHQDAVAFFDDIKLSISDPVVDAERVKRRMRFQN